MRLTDSILCSACIEQTTHAGAASGIGYATAIRLAEDGLDVAVNDLPGLSLDAVTKEITAIGRRAHSVFADVSEEKEVESMRCESAGNGAVVGVR